LHDAVNGIACFGVRCGSNSIMVVSALMIIIFWYE
jgi:hypothetical protein